MKKITGSEPINPMHPDSIGNDTDRIGLTKREYFAALAMQGLLTKYSLKEPTDQEIMAKMSVELSDALITELNK